MAGAHILSAQGGQARFAGNTNPAPFEPGPGIPAPVSAPEAVAQAGIVSELDSILAGGLHPEMFTQPLNRALQAASDSLRGPNGGTVPRPYSSAAPGPAGESVAARGRALLSRLGL